MIIDDNSYDSKNISYLLKQILKDLPCKIKTKKEKFKLGEKINTAFNKIIVPWNLDDECNYFLDCFFNKKKPEFIGHYKINKNGN